MLHLMSCLCALLILACGASTAENTTQDETHRKIESLVSNLRSDDFSDRQQAAKALKEMGDSIVPILKELALKETDVEAKSQIQLILRSLTPPKGLVKDGTIKAAVNQLIILDGTPSAGANGNQVLTYKWEQTEGEDLQLSKEQLTKDRVGMKIRIAGKFRFKLIVSNGEKESDPVFVEVNVKE